MPALGAAGLSLSLSSSGWAVPAADVPQWNTAGNHENILGEEEMADVSLATFHVFDNESGPPLGRGVRLAAGGHGGCGGCGHGGGCGGCGHGGGGGCAHAGCAGCAHADVLAALMLASLAALMLAALVLASLAALMLAAAAALVSAVVTAASVTFRAWLQMSRRLPLQWYIYRSKLPRLRRKLRNLLPMGPVPGPLDICLLLAGV